jgi:LmeA-like phospholipid-binding
MSGRGARRLVVALVVLVVVLVAADRVGDYFAERTAGDTIQTSQDLPSRPDVDIAGFPFLTQLAAGDFDQVTITAHDVPVGRGTRLQVGRLRVVLDRVKVTRNFSRVTADTADAMASISFADLSRALGIDVGYAGSGRIRASKSVAVLGTSVHAALTSRPTLVNGALAFTRTTIANVGELGGDATSALNQVFDRTVPLQNLPFDIRVKSLTVDSGGIHIAFAGKDLVYSS